MQQMEIWLVILFLSGKKVHASQIFVLSSYLKLGPVLHGQLNNFVFLFVSWGVVMQYVDVSSAAPLNSLIARYILDPTLGQTMGKDSKHTGNTFYVVSL